MYFLEGKSKMCAFTDDVNSWNMFVPIHLDSLVTGVLTTNFPALESHLELDLPKGLSFMYP